MFKLLRQLFSTLDKNHQAKVFKFQLLNIFQAIIEFLTLGLIAIYISLINEPTLINQNIYVKNIFENYFLNNFDKFLIFYSITLIFLIIFNFFLAIFINAKMLKLAHNISQNFVVKLYKSFLYKNWSFHVNTHFTDIVRMVNHDTAVLGSKLVIPSLNLSHKVVLIITISSVVTIYNPWVAFFGIFILSSVFYLITTNVKKIIFKNTKKESDLFKEKNQIIYDTFQGIREVILYNLKNFYFKRFDFVTRSHIKPAVQLGLILQIPRLIVEGFAFLTVISFILIALIMNYGTDSILPTIALYAFVGLKLLPSFQQVYMAVVNINNGKPHFYNIQKKLKTKKLDFEIKNSKNNLPFIKGVEMKNLKFSYQKETKKHTLNINHFSINKNSIIGIAGTTGSGKSTLVDILMKITEPKSGKILIDGKVLEKEDFQNWMNKFAMVPQAPHFSNQSILENIAFGSNKSEIDLSKAKQAIKISNLSKKINSLKDGIYTKIGDKGLKLSGGERQRLALARALYFDKEIIVLDEATSSVDSKTEKEIIKSILSLKKNKTLILIAHRINTLKICDTIYLLKEGKITNRGSFKKLLSNSKYFKELNG